MKRVLWALLFVALAVGACQPAPTQALVFDGQSLNNLPAPPTNYPSLLMARHPKVRWVNVAVDAMGWQWLAGNAGDRLFPQAALGDDTTLVMLGGEADLVEGTSAQATYEREVAYAQAARAAGFDHVVFCTIPGGWIFGKGPKNDARLEHNEIAKRDPDHAFDAVVDLDTPPLSWWHGSPYYMDDLHPSDLGASEIARRVDVAVSELLND